MTRDLWQLTRDLLARRETYESSVSVRSDRPFRSAFNSRRPIARLIYTVVPRHDRLIVFLGHPFAVLLVHVRSYVLLRANDSPLAIAHRSWRLAADQRYDSLSAFSFETFRSGIRVK